MENRDSSASHTQSDELTRLKAEMPEVYDYIVRNLDARPSAEGGWHTKFTIDVIDDCHMSWNSFDLIARCIRELCFDTYGTLYPDLKRLAQPEESV